MFEKPFSEDLWGLNVKQFSRSSPTEATPYELGPASQEQVQYFYAIIILLVRHYLKRSLCTIYFPDIWIVLCYF